MKLMSDRLMDIYNCIVDDESKELFALRLLNLFPCCRIPKYFNDFIADAIQQDINMIPLKDPGRKRHKTILTVSEFIKYKLAYTVVIWGVGVFGRMAAQALERLGVSVSLFVDSDPLKWNTEHMGKAVISPGEFFSYCSDAYIIIGVVFQQTQKEIIDDLKENGFPDNQIVTLSSNIQQYFGADFLQPLPDEVYVDVGAYNAETIIQFMNFCNGVYRKIYAIEADMTRIPIIQQGLDEIGAKNVEIICKGAYSKRGVMSFLAVENKGTSRIVKNGNSKIEVAPIDEMIPMNKVTLIKFDIEGAELEALKGCEKIIKQYRPRLLVSIYHKPNDILDILDFVHNLVPEYKFYLRQHSYYGNELILYALV